MRVRERGQAIWYDACCGEGRALIEAGAQFLTSDWGKQVQIIGVDLVGAFAANDCPNVRLLTADVVAYIPDQPLDLVTCVHGLHYLGDKLAFLENAYRNMAPGGHLLAHLDPVNIREVETTVPLWTSPARRVRATGVSLRLTRHLLHIERNGVALGFGVVYRGATVSTIPNYTGITVIDSWYSKSD